MLLRGGQAAGFTVPVVKGRSVEKADPLKDKLDRITSTALEKREAMDARISTVRETARSRRTLLEKLRAAGESGETGKGFAKRFEGELRKAKGERLAGAENAQALDELKAGSDDLDRSFLERALRTEAGTRARERVEKIGKAIDDLVAAARANPARFEKHYEAARRTVERLPLPAKVVAAFRARLPEIPKAALMTLAERDPAGALDLIERRKGPAQAKYGLPRPVVRMIGKQAQANLAGGETEQTFARGADAARLVIDGQAAVEAVKRGEGSVGDLSLLGLGEAGGPHARELKREIRAARKEGRSQEKAAATVRARLAAGRKLDPKSAADDAGLDLLYARDLADEAGDADAKRERDVALAASAGVLPKSLAKAIGDLVTADESERVIAGVKLIEALERVDPELTQRVDRHVLAEAHEILDIVQSGVAWPEAVRLSREGSDVPANERERRMQMFAEGQDGASIETALREALGIAPDAGREEAAG